MKMASINIDAEGQDDVAGMFAGEERVYSLVHENRRLLQEIRQGLDNNFLDPRIHAAVDAFFVKMEQILNYLEQKIPSDTVVTRDDVDYSRKDEFFLSNLDKLLKVVPLDYQNKALQQVSDYFRKSIEKIVVYLKGDVEWLTVSGRSGSNLSLENSSQKVEASPIFELQTEKSEDVGEGDCRQRKTSLQHRRKDGSDYEQLIEYLDVSAQKEITHILDPLFQMLYPQQTMVSSMKHCKEATGKSLATISREKLGYGERGNRLLYRILTDDTLARIFGDDRIIAALEESIHIPLLKTIIYTAVYRLRRFPEKFPVIGGVSFFVEIEEDALGTDLIKNILLWLLVDRDGSKAIFRSASARQRGGIDRMLVNEPSLYREIAQQLLSMGSKAMIVTNFWTLKFACDFARHSKFSSDELQKMFSPDRLVDLERFVRHPS